MLLIALLDEAACPILKLATSAMSLMECTRTFPFVLPEKIKLPRLSKDAAMLRSSCKLNMCNFNISRQFRLINQLSATLAPHRPTEPFYETLSHQLTKLGVAADKLKTFDDSVDEIEPGTNSKLINIQTNPNEPRAFTFPYLEDRRREPILAFTISSQNVQDANCVVCTRR